MPWRSPSPTIPRPRATSSRSTASARGSSPTGQSPGVIAFLHAEVDPSRERRGLGSALVRGALDDARARGLSVRPVCPFVAWYIETHEAYQDLVL